MKLKQAYDIAVSIDIADDDAELLGLRIDLMERLSKHPAWQQVCRAELDDLDRLASMSRERPPVVCAWVRQELDADLPQGAKIGTDSYGNISLWSCRVIQ